MNKAEWAARRVLRQLKLKTFQIRFHVQLAEVAAARAVLAKYARVIRLHERLEERASTNAPEGHVRCQAVHHGSLICDEIMPLGDKKTSGWVSSLVGDLYFCPAHAEHVKIVNKPTLDAPMVRCPAGLPRE
jgi:hypothetical protein